MLPSVITAMAWAFLSSASSVIYDYDELGRLKKADYPDGKSIEYVYDENGNRTEILINGGGEPGTTPGTNSGQTIILLDNIYFLIPTETSPNS